MTLCWRLETFIRSFSRIFQPFELIQCSSRAAGNCLMTARLHKIVFNCSIAFFGRWQSTERWSTSEAVICLPARTIERISMHQDDNKMFVKCHNLNHLKIILQQIRCCRETHNLNNVKRAKQNVSFFEDNDFDGEIIISAHNFELMVQTPCKLISLSAS